MLESTTRCITAVLIAMARLFKPNFLCKNKCSLYQSLSSFPFKPMFHITHLPLMTFTSDINRFAHFHGRASTTGYSPQISKGNFPIFALSCKQNSTNDAYLFWHQNITICFNSMFRGLLNDYLTRKKQVKPQWPLHNYNISLADAFARKWHKLIGYQILDDK